MLYELWDKVSSIWKRHPYILIFQKQRCLLQGKTVESKRVLSFEKEKVLEDWIVERVKIGFTMHNDEVKGIADGSNDEFQV